MALIDSGRTDLPFGIAWLPEWEGPFEGAMSLMLKFGWANCLTGQEICQALFGRKLVPATNPVIHGRTFLAPRWIRSKDLAGAAPITRKLKESGLDYYAAGWFHTIASDISFRYCPVCLNHGYQSVLFQIDALTICPMHGEILQNKCSHCGAQTPRYALTGEAFDRPFHCPSCRNAYAGEIQPSAWKAPELHNQAQLALTPLAQWLETLEHRRLKWWQWSDWFGPSLSAELERERRLSTFSALRRIVPLTLKTNFLTSPSKPLQIYRGKLSLEQEPYSKVALSDVALSQDQIRIRRSIYKSIRRYAVKRIGGCHQTRLEHSADAAEISWIDEVLSLSLKKCVKAQCLLLWRMRFEDASSFSHPQFEKYPRLHLRSSALNWPWTGSADDVAWAAYVLESLHASIEVVKDWWQRAMSIPDADIYGSARAQAMALYMEFAPLFSSKRFPVLPRITIITGAADNRSLDCPLYVVGPLSLAIDGTDFPPCAEDIRCEKCMKRRPVTCGTIDCPIIQLPECEAGFDKPEHRKPAQPQPEHEVPIRTLDRLHLPSDLNGSSGPFRTKLEECLIPARDDLDAIRLWLETVRSKENTYRTYRQQAERCMLWAVCDRNKPLSALDENDVADFSDFLLNPRPLDRWCCAGGIRRTSDEWRPFKAPLSTHSRDQAVRILTILFDWLCHNRYINLNPWSTTPFGEAGNPRRKFAPMAAVAPQKSTTAAADEWYYVRRALEQQPNDVIACRAKALMYLGYFCALRPGELAALTLGMIRTVTSQADSSQIWILTVPGRPPERAFIYLLPPVQSAISAYLESRGRSSNPLKNLSCVPLLAEEGRVPATGSEKSSHSGLDPQELTRIAKRIYAIAAKLALADGKTLVARRLDEASLIWLSNAFEVHALQRDIHGTWPWRLLAAKKTIPQTLLAYMPKRTELPLNEVLLGFQQLQPMWKH